MLDNSKSSGPTGKIEFVENHRPALPSGDYDITVSQSISANGKVTETFVSQERKFAIQGPRFTLEPQVIRSVFPPAGSLGEHSSVLPHISFNRSTLPWERFVSMPEEDLIKAHEDVAEPTLDRAGNENSKENPLDSTEFKTPWFALFLFDQDELVEKIVGEVDKDKFVESELTEDKVSGPKVATLEKIGMDPHFFWELKLSSENKPQNGLISPVFPSESGQQEGDPVSVIDVGIKLLKGILPSREDVELLGHVRQPMDDFGTPVGDQVATLLANRLPQPGKMSVVHLVSLEGKYGDGDIWQLPDNEKFVRLVSLKSWRFTCLDEKHSFKGLLHHLNKDLLFVLDAHLFEPLPVEEGKMKLSDGVISEFKRLGYSFSKNTTVILESFNSALPGQTREESKKDTLQVIRISDPEGTDFMIRKNGKNYEVHQVLPQTLRLPSNHLKLAWQFIAQGFVPLPHEMRQGNRSVSWFRGPLAPGQVDKANDPSSDPNRDKKDGGNQQLVNLPARSADQLVRYNPANGMFDVSYAAAWELGRLLTLQNEKVGVSLLDWKRRHRHEQERQVAMQALEHLPVAGRSVSKVMPADITSWFADLALLRRVPFNYLVPDEKMLPQESIRFFFMDPEWIRCLHDGAFSIGRVLPSDHKRDAAHDQNLLAAAHGTVTGFLMRSEVVSGWPDLLVEGYDETVSHENYEHDTSPPKSPLKEFIPFDRWLQESMNNGDATKLISTFNFQNDPTIEVSPIVMGSRWLLNVNANEKLYIVEKIGDDFRLSEENKLPMLRMERLSPNVLLCMFAGNIQTVDIHQKPEALHFGFNRTEDEPVTYFKELKSHIGGELPECNVEIPLRTGDYKGVVEIQKLNNDIQQKMKEFGGIDSHKLSSEALRLIAVDSVGEPNVEIFLEAFKKAAESATSAQFALQMTEGVQKVRFVAGKQFMPLDG